MFMTRNGERAEGKLRAEEKEVFTAEWEAEMREYGYTQVQIDKMKHGEWEENDADDEGAQRERVVYLYSMQ